MKYCAMERFDYKLLARRLEDVDTILLAFLFGSAQDGSPRRGDSDVDIGILTAGPVSPDEKIEILSVCQDALDFERIDLTFLNRAGYILRFEALSGVPLLIRDRELYADFFSETCRYYEDEMMLLEKGMRTWREINAPK